MPQCLPEHSSLFSFSGLDPVLEKMLLPTPGPILGGGEFIDPGILRYAIEYIRFLYEFIFDDWTNVFFCFRRGGVGGCGNEKGNPNDFWWKINCRGAFIVLWCAGENWKIRASVKLYVWSGDVEKDLFDVSGKWKLGCDMEKIRDFPNHLGFSGKNCNYPGRLVQFFRCKCDNRPPKD